MRIVIRFRKLAVGLFSAFCFVVVFAGGLVAAPYQGDAFTYSQPDGERFQVRLWGDEFFAYEETEDGYLVIRDTATGVFCYARVTGNGADIISTGVRVGQPRPAGLKPKGRLTPEKMLEKSRPRRDAAGVDDKGQLKAELREKLFPGRGRARKDGGQAGVQYAPTEDGIIRLAAADESQSAYAPGDPPLIDKRVGLVLLASFPDRPQDIARTRAQVDAFCNDPDYAAEGNATSVAGYFRMQSNGRVEYTNVVTAWFTASNTRDYYANTGFEASFRGRELVKEGLAVLQAQGFDFSQCDGNGDGVIDGVNCFFAGASSTEFSKGLWPHKSSSTFAGLQPQLASQSFQYQMTDLPGALSIGTFCHENGHLLFNFPDLYSVNGNAANLGTYSIMSALNSKHPGNIDPLLKISAGWASVVDLNSSSRQRCVVQVDRNHFYRYRNPARSGESFLFEVRHNTGYEGPFGGASASNPTSGLAVYHALSSGSNTDSSIFTAQNPNANYGTPYNIMVVEANPAAAVTPWYDDPAPAANDGFKSTDKNQISDTTFPDLKFWASNGRTLASQAQVHSISAAGPTMSFTIGSGDPTTPAEMGVTSNGIAATTNQGVNAPGQSFSVFNKGAGSLSYTVSANVPWLSVSSGSGTVGLNVDVLNLTFSNGTVGLVKGTYSATITLSSPDAANSPITIPVTLNVEPALLAPVITIEPVGKHLLGDQSYTLTATVTAYPAPYFQWYLNDAPIPGANFSSYTIASATFADAGTYHLEVVNLEGTAESAPAVVTVNDHPYITKVAPAVNYVSIPDNNGLILRVTATDDGYGGSLLTNAWSVVSAPPGGNVTWDNTNSAASGATFSATGDYRLRFSSTDGINTRFEDYYVTVGAVANWVASANRIVHYNFAETSGTTAVDAAGGNQNGTLVGGASFSNGKLVLDGSTGYVAVPSGAEIDTAGPYAKRSVAFWFKPDAIPSTRTLYEEGGADAGMNISITASKYLLFRIWNQNGLSTVSTFNSTAHYMGIDSLIGKWHHITVVLDASPTGTTLQGGAFRLYVNGALALTDNGIRIASHPDGIGIGGINGTTRTVSTVVLSNTNFFDGEIKDFRLYNKALTASEVTATYEMSNIGPEVDAGPAVSGPAGFPVALDGTVSDDGVPGLPALATTWSVVSGPGVAVFGDASAVDSPVTAYAVGGYALRLSANDGKVTTFDQTTFTSSSNPGSGQLRIEHSAYSVNERAGTLSIAVLRPDYGGVNGAVSVPYSAADGTAVNGADFTLASGTLSWADQEGGAKIITVGISDDAEIESPETFTVSLGSPSGGAIPVEPSMATVTITDNEIPEVVLLRDTFNTSNTATLDTNLATRQTGTMATSGYTKSGTVTISGNQLSAASGAGVFNNADFRSALTAPGVTRFSLSFDLANTGNNWVSTFFSTHTGADDRGGSRFGMHLQPQANSSVLTAYGDSGTGQSPTSLSRTVLNGLLGYTFNANVSNSYSFVATPSTSTAGSYDLFINGVEALSNIPYLLGSGGTNGLINWENRNISGGVAVYDNLTIRRTLNSAPAWNTSPFAMADATAGTAYSASIAAAALDLDGQTLTYAKTGGPSWLNVSPSGALSGTPGAADAGGGSFTLSVTDGFSTPVQAEMIINVIQADLFRAWAGNGISFDGDSNGDGLADGLAWLLGAAGPGQNATALLPTAGVASGGMTVAFKYLVPSKRGAAVLRLQYSNDLGVTDPWASHTITVPGETGTVDGVAFVITPIAGGILNQIQATIPESLFNPGGKVFMRLGGENP